MIYRCVSNTEDDLKCSVLYGSEPMLGLAIYCAGVVVAVHGAETLNTTQPAHGLESATLGCGV